MKSFKIIIVFLSKPRICLVFLLMVLVVCLSSVFTDLVSAASFKTGLVISAEDEAEFAPNDIIFYNREQCIEGGSTGICGKTAKEKYWTAISKYVSDPIKVAGIMGNLASEGNFQPVLWEYSITNSDGTLKYDWDFIYGGGLDGKKGVGAFAITSGLSTYLKAVEENDSSMLEYFKNSAEYSIGAAHNSSGISLDDEHSVWGDVLLEKVGDGVFDKLIDFEIDYAMGPFKPTTTQEYLDTDFSSPSDAAYWWMDRWEIPGSRNPEDREQYAEKVYDEFKNYVCSSSEDGSCTELGELRTKMWTEASQEDRESFMKTVSEENHSIAGVEGYMNQALAYNDGDLSSWLDGQCKAFRGGASCTGSHTITDDEQDWINEALGGSNHIKFAVGNATGGSDVGAGKIVCVWDGEKCRDDVDYSAEGGKGACSVYSSSADFGECWGLEGAEDWVNETSAKCESAEPSSSSGSSTTTSTASSGSTNSTVSGNNITWIGDSYSEGAQSIIEEKYPGISFGGSVGDASSTIQTSKFVSSGDSSNPSCLTILQDIIDKGNLKPYLVFACGTNGGWSDSDVTKFKEMLEGENTQAVVVTSKIPGTDYAESNKRLKEMANSNDNISLADWTTVYDESYFDGDPEKIHPVTDPGYEKWVGVIDAALGGGSGSGVEWDDGWIVEESMEGAVKQDVNEKTDLGESVNPVGSYTTDDGKPDKILLHNTQELGEGYEVYPSGNKFPAHFTIDLKNKKVWQHFSIYQPSLAVATYDKDGPIQIEIIGYTKRATKKDDGTFEYEEPDGYESEWDLQNFSDEDWDYLAKLLLAISEETGIPLTSSVEWTPGTKDGLSREEFLGYKGVLGHMHTPDNGSEDPGDIWKYIEAAIKRLNNDCVPGTTGEFVWYPQYTGEYSDIEVEVKASANSSSTVKTTMGEIGCGPFAFAMMANMLLPQEITPKDTMEVAIDTDSINFEGSVGSVLTKNLAEHYGMEWEKIDSSSSEATIKDITEHLENGWMIETGGRGSTPYTSGGHYVGIRGITSDGKWLLADPGHSEDVSTEPWDPKDVVTAGMNIDNVYAFRTTSSTPLCDSDICKDSDSSSTGTGVETNKPIGPIHDPSDDIPCDPRTKDLGVRDDAYYDYEQYSIRLCSIPNIKMTGTQGPDGDDGYVHVNSRVSGAFYALSEEHKKRCGNYLEAFDDFRTNDEQVAVWKEYQSGGTLAAEPGSKWSRHQGGLAIDFNQSTYCANDTDVASGPGGSFNLDFLAQFGLEDGRNFSQVEYWHVQAPDE